MPKIEIQTVTAGDCRMEYVSFGNGPRTLVVIPGVALKKVLPSAASIKNMYSELLDDFTLYFFERRDNMPDPYSVFDMAGDTAECIKKLGLKDIYLYGVSQGGMICQIIGLEYPELVRAMALAATASRSNELSLKKLSEWAKLAEEKDVSGLTASFADSLYSDEFLKKYRRIMLSMFVDVSDEDIRRFITQVKGCEGFDIYSELEKLKCPVLVYGARQDKVLGVEASLEIAEKLNCRCHIFEGYGHAFYDEIKEYMTMLKEDLLAI